MVVVGFDPGADGEDIGIEDDVVGVEVESVRAPLAALAHRSAPLQRIRLPVLVEGHDHDRRAIALAQAACSREFLRPGLQADGIDYRLPGMHFSPASITVHLEESTVMGTRAMSGSEAIRLRNRTSGLLGIEHALIHVDTR